MPAYYFNNILLNEALVKMGYDFLLQKTATDWFHAASIVSVDKNSSIFETMEGNTNSDGSHNGKKGLQTGT